MTTSLAENRGLSLRYYVGLIHMGGRYYDPELGRFLSADPFIQEPANAQSLNRYSYVLNNPLSYTDPSGFFFSKIFKAIKSVVKAVVGAVNSIIKAVSGFINSITGGNMFLNAVIAGFAAWYTGGLAFDSYISSVTTLTTGAGTVTVSVASAAITTAEIIGGAVGGFVGGAIMGGDLKSAVVGGVIGGATAFVGSQIKTGIRDFQQGEGSLYQVSAGKGNLPQITAGGSVQDRLFVNGILNDINAAAVRGLEQFNQQSFTLFHNPSSGFIADLTESFLGKVTGTSSISRQLAGILKDSGFGITGAGNLIAHSQGGIIVTNALNQLASQGVSNAINLSVTFNGAAVSRFAASNAVNGVGGTLTAFNAHPFDLVPNVIGLNAITNPFRFVGSILASPTLFMGPQVSPHTVYP